MKSFFMVACFVLLGVASAQAMTVTSTAFKNGTPMPVTYTCDGGNVNPPLTVVNLPPATQSMALTVNDPDAPVGNWVHWVVYDIPPATTEIKENSIPGKQALNDFGNFAYGGPCPPDHKTHRYIFTIYALRTVLEEDPGMTMRDLLNKIGKSTIAKAQIVGTYTK